MVDWTHFFWSCGSAAHHDGEHMVEHSYLPPGMETKQRKIEKGVGIVGHHHDMNSIIPSHLLKVSTSSQ